MPNFIDLRNIRKFDGTNFQVWKFQLKVIFVAMKLMEIVNGTKKREEAISDATRIEWDENNARAMVIISTTMETSQLEFLITCETAAEMWNKLCILHEPKSESKLHLMMHFHKYKMASGDKIALHKTKVENIARQLRDIGEILSDLTIMAKILTSLSEKYKPLVTLWDSVEYENLTLDEMKQRLIIEEARMNAADEASDALNAMRLKTNKTRQKTKGKKPEHKAFF